MSTEQLFSTLCEKGYLTVKVHGYSQTSAWQLTEIIFVEDTENWRNDLKWRYMCDEMMITSAEVITSVEQLKREPSTARWLEEAKKFTGLN